ncbi:hypothetical protein [Qipengyuania sediminis]|uniref:hypothetical protein n=1 Tax=Qipengyuania sediminis TaxID=1532023 RepID=UPI00105A17FD|nr:hypothetical protein [Qipengyuania sediminis]
MPRKLRLMLAIGVMPALAIFAALFSLSTIATGLVPERATQLPVLNANAHAAEAAAGLGGFGTPKGAEAAAAMTRAGRETFLSEPINANAISLMALARQLGGDLPGARALYEHAIVVDKRNRLANLWLIEDASANGRLGYILDRYDVLLRTGGPTSTALYDTLATALREPAMVPHLEARLVRNPPWAEQFWLRVAPNPGAIANLGELRLRLLARKIGNPANNDGDIVRRLVGLSEYDIAARLARSIAGAPAGGGFTIRNGEFAARPLVPPFDWETYTGTEFGAELDPASGVLSFFSVTSIDNLVAHQLSEAKAGRYVINYRVRNPEVLGQLQSTLRLRCAEPAMALGTLPLTRATGGAAFTVPPTCRYLWVELWAKREAAPSGYPEDALLESVEVRAAP